MYQKVFPSCFRKKGFPFWTVDLFIYLFIYLVIYLFIYLKVYEPRYIAY